MAFGGVSPFRVDYWRINFNYAGVKIDGEMGRTHFGYMLSLGLNKYSRDNDNDDYLGNISGTWPKQIEQDPKRPLAYYTLREKLKEMMSQLRKRKNYCNRTQLWGCTRGSVSGGVGLAW